jgi:predicted ATPase/DNA-binding SARP family transcriptional activator
MRFSMLGPLQVSTSAGDPVTVPELKVRKLLAMLLVHRGQPVPADRLIEVLWPEDLPTDAGAALRSKVSQLRRALHDAEPGAGQLVRHHRPGYLLCPAEGTVDADRFHALVGEAADTTDLGRRIDLLSAALRLWRGEVLADFADEEFTWTVAGGLAEARLTASELLFEARLDRGEPTLLIGELTELVARYPYRERLRACHIRALYQLGRQQEALDSYRQLREVLRDTLGVEPSPQVQALHTAVLRQDTHLDGQAPRRPARPHTNLPSPLTELIGRDEAVAETAAWLTQSRLVTLTGPGGVGKTRLAIATGAVVDQFPDGVWLIELGSLAHWPPGTAPPSALYDPVTRIVDLINTVLGFQEEAAPGPPSDYPTPQLRLADLLRPRRLLLIMDNCEHLVEPVATLVQQLLQAAPEVRILATSREPLGIPGELVRPVPPLAVPGSDPLPDLSEAAQYSAVELFTVRAAESAPEFRLDQDTIGDVISICRQLDGLPLALELAATRVRSLGVRELAVRLDDRFRLLSARRPEAPARQQTLRAVIDWSWELLTEPEQKVLRRLAVHSGGCRLAAAEQVCSGDGVDQAEVAELLARLVDRSLVVADGQPLPRYRLPESVSAYCRQRLQEAGELASTQARHRQYYTSFAEHADPRLRGPQQREWLQALDAETANLQAALTDAARHRDAVTALRLTCALAWYWVLRGRLDDGSRSLLTALTVPGPAPEELRTTAQTWYTAIARLAGQEPDSTVRVRGRLPDPTVHASDPTALARAQGLLAVVTPAEAEEFGGEDLVERVLQTAEATGYEWGVAAALSTRAWRALLRSDIAAVRRDAERSVALFRRIGDPWGILHAIDPLATLARLTGDWQQARQLHLDGLTLAEELGLWPKVAYELCELGCLALETGDVHQADHFHERARQLAAEQSYRPIEQRSEIGLAISARHTGRFTVAEQHLRRWLAWNQQVRWEDGTATVLTELGFLSEQRGDATGALRHHLGGFRAAQRSGEPRVTARSLDGLAGACALNGWHKDAAHLLGAAARVRQAVGAPLPGLDRTDVDRITTRTRQALGADAFDDAVAVGRAQDPEPLIARLELEVDRDGPTTGPVSDSAPEAGSASDGTASGRLDADTAGFTTPADD